MAYYLFRIDDITRTMNSDNFLRCMDIFNKYDVKPILGLIPENKDHELSVHYLFSNWLQVIKSLYSENKITIAQHGYQHVYHRSKKSEFYKYGIGTLTEFAGLAYDSQFQKINRGKIILDRAFLPSQLWMAPNHSFDRFTLKALYALGFRYITDGIGLFPYKKHGLYFLPVLSGKPRKIPFGMTTICLHTNMMTENDFSQLEKFIKKAKCQSFEQAVVMPVPKYALFVNIFVRIFFYIIKKFKRILQSVFYNRKDRQQDQNLFE